MLFLKLLPGEWRRAIEALLDMNAVRIRPLVLLLLLNSLRVVTELFGLVLILPVLKYIELKGDTAALVSSSHLWQMLINAFDIVSLPVNLITLSGAVFMMILVRQIVGYYSTVMVIRLKEDIGARMSSELFTRIIVSHGLRVQSLGSGAFITLVNQHCHSTGSVVANMVNTFVVVLTVAAYGGTLVVLAPIPAIVAAAFGVGMLWLMKPFTNQAKHLSRKITDTYVNFGKFLGERYQNWRLLKLALGRHAEDIAVVRWNRRIADLNCAAAEAAGKIQLYVTPLAAAFLLAGLIVLHDFAKLSLAELTMFLLAFMRLMPSLENLLRTRQSLANLSGALFRVHEAFGHALANEEVDTGPLPFCGLDHSIEFKDVTFAYPGSKKNALDGVTVSAKAGAMTALTGPSGGGKSTLLDMIPRLLTPDSGRVFLDGVPIESFQLASLRRAITYVTQQPLIFDATVTENIRYLHKDATDEEIRNAAILAHADAFIRELPQGYETLLGEGGARLSGGQRQRVVLARAFLSGASIIILDEPTSALDFESERQIQLALEGVRRRGDITILVIAHRLSTIREADQVIVLCDGRVIEHGAPDELLGRAGWFADMAQHADGNTSVGVK